MYAIVEIAGQQFKVAKNQKVFVHRLQDKEGSKITFDNVLLLDDGKITIGAPAIEGAAVTAKILRHLKGDKVIVFKKKRRKGYKVKNGHRQYLSEIQIEGIVASGAKKAPAKKAEPKKETPKTKVATKKEVAPKKAAAKKAPAKATKADDLKKVEGIGPKIAEIFIAAGIDTFAKLAKASQKDLKAILEAAGSRYASKNPGSWPKQAKMAADGKWDELKKWQDEVKGGIE
ncbi:MAG TPA: 50S ribosomal protein L21 [Flavobacteriaceae bacterium]|jgi:large subunit ribosomal protein L21|nr:50S ribosomal protein L21 [Flavobacteriaceae bacterium]HBS12095.1 50S ribosomal protein L21 [Flavobacteriaceae bacterium]